MREPHTTYVELISETEFRAKCADCNWKYPIRPTQAAAQKDTERHA